ncbi:peptidylprolyl isomerase [Candidatus Uhrbacteria bacterium]|nr:peptidylprolyl isomerase [Candidatus Uhrbacteria bacterium]
MLYRSYRSRNSVSQELAPVAKTPHARTTYTQAPSTLPAEELLGKKARITTTNGDIVIRFFSEEAPKTVSNFVTLARDGFYDGLTFHRREEGFVIQGGDPNGNGTGGPGYQFADEPVRRPYTRGIVAMANAGPNTNGSQFFIMLDNKSLPALYTIFGIVESGMNVVDSIRVGDVLQAVRIE